MNIAYNNIFKEMTLVYEEAIPEMGFLGEIDWRNAAKTTLKRIVSYLNGELRESYSQLARECHADLQGYVEVKFGANLLDAQDCRDRDCLNLYLIGKRLVQIGGLP